MSLAYIRGFEHATLKIEYNLNFRHLFILMWLDELINSGKATTVEHRGKTFYWVKYQSVANDAVILGIGKQSVELLFYACRDAGILEHYHASSIPGHRVGSYSCYRFIPEALNNIKPPYKPKVKH